MTNIGSAPTWHIAPLRAWVIRTHGDEQWRRVNECLQSVFERQGFAKYHHGEVKRLLHDPLAELPHFDRVAWTLGVEVDGMEETFGTVRFMAAAHVLATVQTMHALVDTLAQVLRYVFALPSNDPEYAPPAKKVHENLPDGRIKDLFGELIQHPEGEYLEALSNRSKHHSIVAVGYSIPLDEGGTEGLMWRPFTNKRKSYPARPVRDTLVAEFQRQQDILFAIFAELDSIAAGP
jgi:hypothetical protein